MGERLSDEQIKRLANDLSGRMYIPDRHRLESIEGAALARGHELAEAREQIEALRARVAALEAERQLLTHKMITCGVIAEGSEHRNSIYSAGSKWDSPQAERVRAVVAERDDARRELAALREGARGVINDKHDLVQILDSRDETRGSADDLRGVLRELRALLDAQPEPQPAKNDKPRAGVPAHPGYGWTYCGTCNGPNGTHAQNCGEAPVGHPVRLDEPSR